MISVVIPTLNEARNLTEILDRLAREDTPHEIIVVDGGSTDGTRAIAQASHAVLLEAPVGRGLQLREGATRSSGDILWFLHADCRVPTGALGAINEALAAAPQAPGGNFQLKFDGSDPFSRWLDGFYDRLRRHGHYYGDSGVFVRRAVYDKIGGFKPLMLMEDYAFNRALEKCGPTVVIRNPVLITSSRRFQGRRKWAIIWQWLLIHALYHMGVPSQYLARLYNSARRPA